MPSCIGILLLVGGTVWISFAAEREGASLSPYHVTKTDGMLYRYNLAPFLRSQIDSFSHSCTHIDISPARTSHCCVMHSAPVCHAVRSPLRRTFVQCAICPSPAVCVKNFLCSDSAIMGCMLLTSPTAQGQVEIFYQWVAGAYLVPFQISHFVQPLCRYWGPQCALSDADASPVVVELHDHFTSTR